MIVWFLSVSVVPREAGVLTFWMTVPPIDKLGSVQSATVFFVQFSFPVPFSVFGSGVVPVVTPVDVLDALSLHHCPLAVGNA